jgi:hypothetical protein
MPGSHRGWEPAEAGLAANVANAPKATAIAAITATALRDIVLKTLSIMA